MPKKKNVAIALRLEMVGGSTVITSELDNGQTFSKTVDGDLNDMPEAEQQRILTQAYLEAGSANAAFKETESFASIVERTLKDQISDDEEE